MRLKNNSGLRMAACPQNMQLNWLLIAYQRSGAVLGQIADPETAHKTMKELRKRAAFEAMLRGCHEQAVAEDGLSAMLEWVGTSNLPSRFVSERGTARRYINKILARFVQKEIYNWRTRNEPLSGDGISTREVDPAINAQVKNLLEVCRTRLAHKALESEPCKSDDALPGREYVRKHRQRKLIWKHVEDLFPDARFRPKKRR